MSQLKSTADMIDALQRMHEFKEKIAELAEQMFGDSDLFDRLQEAIHSTSPREAERCVEALRQDGKKIEAALDDMQRCISTATSNVINAKYAANRRRNGTDNVKLR